MTTSMKEVFMNRDGLTEVKAREEIKELSEEFNEIMECGGSYDEVEELLLNKGFEMDYIFDLFI